MTKKTEINDELNTIKDRKGEDFDGVVTRDDEYASDISKALVETMKAAPTDITTLAAIADLTEAILGIDEITTISLGHIGRAIRNWRLGR